MTLVRELVFLHTAPRAVVTRERRKKKKSCEKKLCKKRRRKKDGPRIDTMYSSPHTYTDCTRCVRDHIKPVVRAIEVSHTQLAKISVDQILDLTAVFFLHFFKIKYGRNAQYSNLTLSNAAVASTNTACCSFLKRSFLVHARGSTGRPVCRHRIRGVHAYTP